MIDESSHISNQVLPNLQPPPPPQKKKVSKFSSLQTDKVSGKEKNTHEKTFYGEAFLISLKTVPPRLQEPEDQEKFPK